MLGLFLDWQRTNQGSNLLGGLPLGQLTQALLTGPYRGVDDLEVQVTGSWVEDEDGTVDGLGGEVALKGLVDRDAVDVGVVDEPDDLVREELAVVLRREVRLGGLGRVELQRLANALAQHVERRVGLHDLGHGLVDERLDAREPVAEGAVEVVREVDADHDAGRRRVDRHRVGRVVEELGTRVALNVVRVKVAPAQLHVDPVLVRGRGVVHVVRVAEQRRLRHLPLVRSEQQNVGARRVHLVALARMDGLLLHHLDLERIELLIEHLAQIHRERLVDLLPQVRTEDLNQRDLERRNLAVHKDAREIELHLEADVHVGAVDRRRPPQREAAVRNLVETRTLRVRQLLVLHALLEAARLLPEQTLPRRKVRSTEQRVLENALDTTESLNHVGTVVVERPQLAIVALMRPPEWIDTKSLILLKISTNSPTLIVCQSMSIYNRKSSSMSE